LTAALLPTAKVMKDESMSNCRVCKIENKCTKIKLKVKKQRPKPGLKSKNNNLYRQTKM